MSDRFPWTKGPSAKFREGVHVFKIDYRYRDDGDSGWHHASLHRCVASSRDDAMKKSIGFLRKAHPNTTFELVECKELEPEAAIQTGEKVETVSESEYERLQREKKEKTEYERKKILEEKGYWLP